MKPETRKSVLSAAMEAAFVVLGVSLALIGNEWRQGVGDRERAKAAKLGIVEELKANRAQVAASLEYHEGLWKILGESRAKSEKPEMRVFSKGFIHPARIGDTAWTSASEAGAMAHLPYPEVLKLSSAYSQQRRYEDQARSVGGLLYEEILRHGTPAILDNYANLFYIVSIFIHQERELLATYDQKLSEID